MIEDATPKSAAASGRIDRRKFVVGAGAVLASAYGAKVVYEKRRRLINRADVFIAKAERYEDDLASIIERGLTELGLDRRWAKGKAILLKPNLVEPNLESPHINTHPAVVRAAADVFRRWDARDVFVAEGQGHIRDTYFVLEQSGLGTVLDEMKVPFVDLNHDEIFTRPNRLGATKLTELYLPTSLKRADLIVSLPKMKVHHWAGVTLSMKNLFGVMPGICYGWPKNVLHQVGIEGSIVDINATVQPHLAIVDGIVGMEGDGPIMGTPRKAGVLVMGTNFPAVDATCTRLMGLDPRRITYLEYADGRLGPIMEGRIQQRGEAIARLQQKFRLLDHPEFDRFRS